MTMKKSLSFLIAFLIVSAGVAAVVYAGGYLFDIPSIHNVKAAICFGLSAGLGGALGPVISRAVSARFSENN